MQNLPSTLKSIARRKFNSSCSPCPPSWIAEASLCYSKCKTDTAEINAQDQGGCIPEERYIRYTFPHYSRKVRLPLRDGKQFQKLCSGLLKWFSAFLQLNNCLISKQLKVQKKCFSKYRTDFRGILAFLIRRKNKKLNLSQIMNLKSVFPDCLLLSLISKLWHFSQTFVHYFHILHCNTIQQS